MTVKDIKFWLDEKDLKTPIHDEMVLFTFNNAKKIIDKFKINFQYETYTTAEEIKSILKNEFRILKRDGFSEKEIEDKLNLLKNDYEVSFDNEKIIEFPLKGYNGFNLGYLDLVYIFKIKHGGFIGDWLYEKRDIRKVGFEIKPEVKSIGEVLRQFQYYKSNMPPSTKLILVTKTKGLKEVFESQGFFVYEYKGGQQKL